MRIRERLVKFTSLSDLEASGFDLSDPRNSPAKEAELATLKTCVVGAMDLLPETYREVYERREILGESAQTVASDLHLSISAVKSRLLRARAMMREFLDSGLGCRDM
jgi:RNA polymerase sigma-70 factor (ECF subfamily)